LLFYQSVMSEDAPSLADVLKADAEQRAADREGPPPDRCAEALALKTLFTDASACATCETTLGGRWSNVLDNWRTCWELSEDEPLGAAILQVVDDLDASHLLPSGISERLGAGNTAACFGLATLLSNMQAPSDPKSEAPAE
jgi:hypothetical protein